MMFLDSNVWIFASIQEYPEHAIAARKLQESEKEGIAINSIIFSEVFHKLSVLLGKAEAAKRTGKILSSDHVYYIELEKDTVKRSLQLALKFRINDALIAQHSIDTKLPLLTDNIRHFKGIENLRVLPLR